MKVYVLFETDKFKSHSSRVMLGVFSSWDKAKLAFIENTPDESEQNDFVVVEVELNEFGEV